MQQRLLYSLITITIHSYTVDTFDQLARFVASFNYTVQLKKQFISMQLKLTVSKELSVCTVVADFSFTLNRFLSKCIA
jgi:hypothetical protein